MMLRSSTHRSIDCHSDRSTHLLSERLDLSPNRSVLRRSVLRQCGDVEKGPSTKKARVSVSFDDLKRPGATRLAEVEGITNGYLPRQPPKMNTWPTIKELHNATKALDPEELTKLRKLTPYMNMRKYIIIKDAADDTVLAVATSVTHATGSGKTYNLKENSLFGLLGFQKMDNDTLNITEKRVIENNGLVGMNLFKLEYCDVMPEVRVMEKERERFEGKLAILLNIVHDQFSPHFLFRVEVTTPRDKSEGGKEEEMQSFDSL